MPKRPITRSFRGEEREEEERGFPEGAGLRGLRHTGAMQLSSVVDSQPNGGKLFQHMCVGMGLGGVRRWGGW